MCLIVQIQENPFSFRGECHHSSWYNKTQFSLLMKTNLVVTAGMLNPANGHVMTVLWQFINQSVNVFCKEYPLLTIGRHQCVQRQQIHPLDQQRTQNFLCNGNNSLLLNRTRPQLPRSPPSKSSTYNPHNPNPSRSLCSSRLCRNSQRLPNAN
jgi:Sideroflexins